jgi:hypothetical protein
LIDWAVVGENCVNLPKLTTGGDLVICGGDKGHGAIGGDTDSEVEAVMAPINQAGEVSYL